MNEVITDEIGSSVRGKAELRISRPPLTTDFAPLVIECWTSWKANRHAIRCAKNAAPRVPPRRIDTRMK